MSARKTYVYIVGDDGPEHNSVHSLHLTRAGALRAWNRVRKGLLRNAKHMLAWSKKHSSDTEMYEGIIKALSCTDPKKIDNYPHETPYIHEMKLRP